VEKPPHVRVEHFRRFEIAEMSDAWQHHAACAGDRTGHELVHLDARRVVLSDNQQRRDAQLSQLSLQRIYGRTFGQHLTRGMRDAPRTMCHQTRADEALAVRTLLDIACEEWIGACQI